MVSVGRHENITLLSYSEIEAVSGYVGNFKARVRKKARYVDEDVCTGCGACVEKCPWKKIPSDFEMGLGTRPAIYFSFPQAVPRVPVIDARNCAYFLRGKCGACEKFCHTHAINFGQQDEIVEMDVGMIILATGFKDFDPSQLPQYGFRNNGGVGKLDNVFTSMMFERMINTGGPTGGKLLLKDGRQPESIAILHCVGSRDKTHHEYCSRVCCMYSLKLAQLARHYAGAQVFEFYRDMRAFGKDYESFYRRVGQEGVHFVRFDREIQVSQHNNRLKVTTVDVYTGRLTETLVDMVVLSTGMEAQADQLEVAKKFGVSLSPDGFFLERHPKLAPVETPMDGVFIAGACQGPKDIPDSVAQGGAAAAVALSMMDAGSVTLEPFTSYVDQENCGGCHTCEGLCPYGAIHMIDHNGRVVADLNEVLCKGCGACAAACPAQAITQNGFTHGQIMAEIEGVLFDAIGASALPVLETRV
jgi:heterodisulfide reductase subunit A